jgi:cobalt-zinc-cadmium efflux system outer membrane protein
VFGQRGLRVDARRAGFERAAASVSDAARRTLGTVDRTFYRVVAAARRLALAEEILGLNQRLADAAQRQLAAGEISRLDFNLAIVELGRSRSRAMAAHRDRSQSELELRRLVGMSQSVPLEPVFDPALHTARDVFPLADSASDLDVDRLTERALGTRPDVVEGQAATKEAAAEAALARREALPNLVLRAVSEPGLNRRVLRPGLGVTFPVFNLNRGESSARQALTRQAELEHLAVSSRVRTDIATAVATYRSAVDEVRVLESTVLGPARQNRQLLETAYREGEVGLPVLLLIRNQVIDAELDYWTAWLAEREALAALLEATGAHLPAPTERAQ